MSNSEESANKGGIGESLKKLKRKFETIKGYEGDEIIMFEFVLKGFAESKIWDKIKEPLSPKLNEDEYSICCENTTHMMNALKEARRESREMLLYIHHSLKMLLDIISKMNRKLEDEKIKRNVKGKEKGEKESKALKLMESGKASTYGSKRAIAYMELPNGFFFWKARFKTYVKSKDIDLWQVIQNGDFYFEVEDEETKLMKENLYELLKDTNKNQLGKNEEARMTFYNALPLKEYGRVFMCKTAKEILHTLIITHQGNSQVKNCKIDLLTQEYKKFSISSDETIDSGFTRFYTIVTSLKSLDPDYSSKNHIRKVLRALLLNGELSDKDEEINLVAKNFRKLSRKGVTVHDKFDICQVKAKGGESSRCERECYNCGSKNHLSEDDNEPRNDATYLMAIDSQEVQPNPSIYNNDSNIFNLQKENEELLNFSKDFLETYEKLLQEKHILKKEHSKLSSKVNELELEVKNLASNKEVIEPGKKCVELTQEVDSLKSNVSKLQNETFNISKFKKSSIALDDMLSCQKLSQDKEGLAFLKIDKTTSVRREHNSLNDHRITYYGYTNHNNVHRRPLHSCPLNQDKHIIPKSKVINLDDDMIEEQAVQNHDRTQNPNYDLEEVIPRVENISETRDHPIDQVIGELDERTLKSHAQDRSNFFAFVSSIEPKNIKKAINDESWTVAMQEELDQFVRNNVWDLVPYPEGHTIIGTKWVFRNKLHENGIVCRNKASLVAQGYNQQGIDYDDTYAPLLD
ncbi:DUF4219 domain-containing protein [Tanacetum coccineum]